jgi:hypothetical protein
MTVIWIDSGRFSVASAYDTDAQNYITAVESSSYDNTPLETTTKNAMNQLVLALKAGNIWTNAAQIILPCGPRSLAAAAGLALKGTNPTNNGFTSGDYNRKTGLGKASNANAYLDNNVAVNSIGATSHALFAHGSIAQASGNAILLGRHSNNAATDLIVLDEWSSGASGRAFRSATFTIGQFPVSTSTAAATCMIGSRTSATSSTLYVDGSSASSSTSLSLTLSAQNFYTFAYNNNDTGAAGHSSAILQAAGIFSTGLNATQAAALRSAFAAYVSAIASAF